MPLCRLCLLNFSLVEQGSERPLRISVRTWNFSHSSDRTYSWLWTQKTSPTPGAQKRSVQTTQLSLPPGFPWLSEGLGG